MRRALALSLAAAVMAGCARRTADSTRALPTGDAVWFEDGIGPEAQDAEETLERAGLSMVFLPAARLAREKTAGRRWSCRRLPVH